MKSIFLLIIGFILGIAITLVLLLKIFPSQMIITRESRFGMDETVDLIDSSSTENGWAVAKVWDLGDRMIKAGYEDAPMVKVVEICHAENTYNVLKNEDDMFISVLMPCRMAVYEYSDGRTFVSRMNIGLMSKLFSPNVKSVMSGVAEDDEKILNGIIKTAE